MIINDSKMLARAIKLNKNVLKDQELQQYLLSESGLKLLADAINTHPRIAKYIYKNNEFYTALDSTVGADFWLELINNGVQLRYVPIRHQSEELCIAAVTKHWVNIKWVLDQTPSICRLAFGIAPISIRYMFNQPVDMCMEAINLDPIFLKFIVNQTNEMCIAAVTKKPKCMRYIKDVEHNSTAVISAITAKPSLFMCLSESMREKFSYLITDIDDDDD